MEWSELKGNGFFFWAREAKNVNRTNRNEEKEMREEKTRRIKRKC